MNLNNENLTNYVNSLGVDLFGFAATKDFTGAPKGTHPNDILEDAKSVLVFAKRFLTSTIKANSTIPYTIIRNKLSVVIDHISLDIAYFLENQGYIALPTGSIGPSNYDTQSQRSRGLISLKHAAELAGLGRIGKNTLLINEKYGNMIWLGAVITNAEFIPGKKIEKNYCIEDCTLCIDNCPVNALDSTPVMNQLKCWNYGFGKENGGDFKIKCHTCRSICPLCEGIC